jgi:GAF domain-containing protein
LELILQQNHPTRNPQPSVSAALTAMRANEPLGGRAAFAGEDTGRSLAEMAQRDLDAALQLLADRAQFITGASGAAIALRRDGRDDMLCRASSGSNAPELGALLSSEFGLSGESVRTRQLLRCDDAESDARVNREVCRQLGIASVLVMPVVNDDEVLGVFELFSGKANAFGERDLSAVQRLSGMVETAVRLAQVTETFQQKLRTQDVSTGTTASPGDKQILHAQIFDEQILDEEILEISAPETMPIAKAEENSPLGAVEIQAETAKEKAPAAADPVSQAGVVSTETLPQAVHNEKDQKATPAVASEAAPAVAMALPKQAESQSPRKTLLWSAASAETGREKAAESDESHVPPVLRGLRKCEACGFPISGGRELCVECEEKRWRGQLKRAQLMPTGSIPQASAPTAESRGFAAAAPSRAKTSSVPSGLPKIGTSVAIQSAPATAVTEAAVTEAKEPAKTVGTTPSATAADVAENEVKLAPVEESLSASPVFSAGLERGESWFSSNKYVIGALLLIAVIAAAFFLFH